MYFLLDDIFPPVENADENGLLAVGGNLDPSTLLNAYCKGIFPWFNEDEPILWWSPDPRIVLYPANVNISKSMKQVLKKNIFTYTINKAFDKVIDSCREQRQKEEGTWISPGIVEAYIALHKDGHAHSYEVWMENELVGGLYGIEMGKCFFGESMFSAVSNASKAALIFLCKELVSRNFILIDCQVSNPHLKSMGAIEIPREEFMRELEGALND